MPLVGEQQGQAADILGPYEYVLPAGRVAQRPAKRRVMARLMALDLAGGGTRHLKVAHLVRLLRAGDLLVLNDTKVVPARLAAQKPSGGAAEVLLLSPATPQASGPGWEEHQALVRGLGGAESLLIAGDPPVEAAVVSRGARGRVVLRLPVPALELARQRGRVPLPPYIKRPQGPAPEDARRYQTVYAAHEGAVAAPTAGLHLSPALLEALQRRGVERAHLTLHVGYGTFAEPAAEDLLAGRLHPEWVQVPDSLARAVARTRRRGGRVVAVGTTCARALEWRAGPGGTLRPGGGWCDLLITEGHRFKVLDGLLTNFHLPRTTLVMLVAALVGRRRVLDAYAEAVERGYRFYSFGDAMLAI